MYIFIGSLVHTLDRTTIQYSTRSIVGVGSTGIIDFVVHDVFSDQLEDVLKELLATEEFRAKGWSAEKAKRIVLSHGEFLLPGFIDTHTHAPQFPNISRGQQYELLDWLNHVTFPAEERLADVEYARKIYREVVKRVLSFGTTTCCYYGSLHLEATKALADECLLAGQRAFVGKCNMDRNGSPTYVERNCTASISDTKALIDYVHSLPPLPSQSSLVHPIITPRFAISCTDELLSSLGKLASQYPKMAIQTHVSENPSEIAFVKELFPDAPHYTGVYDTHGLLREGTILGHAVHLTDDEVRLIKERNGGIAHCPTSNFNIRSGMANVGKYLDQGIKVGLGTDCSGGYSPSILKTIQDACVTSKMVSLFTSPGRRTQLAQAEGHEHRAMRFEGKHLPIATLLFLATLGGAEVCCLQEKIGNFVVGKEFDALVVSVPGEGGRQRDEICSGGNPGVWYHPEDDLPTLLERFLFGGDDRNIKEVYVSGRAVSGWGVRS